MQYGRPTSTISLGGWSVLGAATHHEATDEVTPNGDTDYIEASSGDTICQLKFSALDDPAVSTGHTLRFTAKSVGGKAGPERLDVGLFAGSTLVVWCFTTLSIHRGSYQLYEYPLDGAEADAISDYTDLRIRIIVNTLGSGETIRVTQIELEIPDAAGAQEYYQDVAGILTSAGLIAKRSALSALTGTLGSSGAVVRQVALSALSGALTSAGTLTKWGRKVLAGGLTAEGVLTRQAQTAFAGTLSTTGTVVRGSYVLLTGGLPARGALIRQGQKVLAGGLTPGGALDALKGIQGFFKLLTGALGLGGALSEEPHKVLGGTLTTAGAARKRTALSVLQGALTPQGTLSALKVAFRLLVGALGLGGVLSKGPSKVLDGTLTAMGDVTKQTRLPAFFGTLAPKGGVAKQTLLAVLTGTLALAGAVVRWTLPSAFLGTLTSAGTVIKSTTVSLRARIRPQGTLAKSGGEPVLQASRQRGYPSRISTSGMLSQHGRTRFL